MLSYNVADLLRAAPGTSLDIPVSLAELDVADDLKLAAPVVGRIRLQHSGRGILVRGHVDTALTQRCSRCLGPATATVSVDIVEEALPSIDLESGAHIGIDDEPEVMRLDDHHELDLEPAIRDAISLAEPIAPLCRADCPGLCSICGADLRADRGHAHDDDDIDPRLTALSGIRARLQ